MWFFQAWTHLGDTIVWIGIGLLLLAFYFRRERKAYPLRIYRQR